MPAIDSLTPRHHRNNLIFNSMHESFWGFGVAFHSIYAVVPLFLSELGAPTIIIGSVVGVFTAFTAMPQIVTAFLSRRTRNVKLAVMTVNSLLIPPMFVVGFIFAFIAPSGPSAWIIYYVCYIFYTLGVGIVFPIWADFLETVHIPERRGSFFGISFAFTSGAGFAGGLIVRRLLDTTPFPNNFGFGFLIYSACILGATLMFIPYTTRKRKKKETSRNFSDFISEIRTIIINDKNFRRYIASRILLTANYPAISLYAVYSRDKLGFDISEAGTFTAITVAMSGIASFAAGKIGDQFGHKHAMVLVFTSYLAALVTALSATTMLQTYLIFIFLGLGQGGFLTSAMSLVYEFAGEEGDKKVYFALIDSLTAPFVLLFIIIVGLLIPVYGTPLVLMGLGLFILAGTIFLALFTEEPKVFRTHFPSAETLM
ncbi:MAG: MFS transporter [Candidatus Marinimicrobia bacterium]|jgi:MFS family permease|nr:MFS transporter [Candidatus Neomarinimicrobiota bacterium]MDP6593250.1 MFS transporter [Candidatus Neomarinimicrobiota bacterium]MDP6836044.1 MFS transporter [Candidatus Neomarinimicrobiota bacterium]|tara:strand:+ start:2380 stop:3660 length:1281 start_codon:yes stop_codon:yes gene_type:complete